MIYQSLTALRGSIFIVFLLLFIDPIPANATEYVFSAPPEVGQESLEIPTQETDYPFYECGEEVSETEADSTANKEEQENLDPHGCDCIECGDMTQNEEPERSY